MCGPLPKVPANLLLLPDNNGDSAHSPVRNAMLPCARVPSAVLQLEWSDEDSGLQPGSASAATPRAHPHPPHSLPQHRQQAQGLCSPPAQPQYGGGGARRADLHAGNPNACSVTSPYLGPPGGISSKAAGRRAPGAAGGAGRGGGHAGHEASPPGGGGVRRSRAGRGTRGGRQQLVGGPCLYFLWGH